MGRQQAQEEDKAQKRGSDADSGRPGGGAGRRDEVGGSGVYPASGPLPPGEAKAQGMASWGQGERGAEGYNDSGRSELWFTEAELKEMKRSGVGRDQVKPGMEVVGSDGALIGSVKDFRGNDLRVARPQAHDVFVPFAAIRSFENNRLTLDSRADQVDQQDWETPAL